MTQGRINTTDIFSDLDDIELSLEADSVSESDEPSISSKVEPASSISAFSLYLSEIRKYPRIDHETEFWYGVILFTGKILREGQDSLTGSVINKESLLNYLLKRVLQDVKSIKRISLPENLISFDVAMLFSEAVIIRMEDFFEKSSYLLNLITENGLYKNEEWEKVSELAVDILACLNALPLDLFSVLSFRFYQARDKSEVPSIKYLLDRCQPESWDLNEVYERVERARENLCLANLRLVIKFAKKYAGFGIPFPDLVQEGNEGLLVAIDKYDPSKGLKFSTYASNWIRQRISRSVKNNSRIMRLPVYLYEKYSRIIKVEEELGKRLGYPPDDAEISDYLEGFSESDISEIRGYFNGDPLSLDVPVSGDSDSFLLDFNPDKLVKDPLEIALWKDFRESILKKVAELFDERDYNIFLARYGFLDGEVHTLQDISEEIGVTRERVRQIQEMILRKLRSIENRHLFA